MKKKKKKKKQRTTTARFPREKQLEFSALRIGTKNQDGQAFAKSRSRKKWPTHVARLMLVVCLVVEIIQHRIFALSDRP